MRNRLPIRLNDATAFARLAAVALCLAAWEAAPAAAQEPSRSPASAQALETQPANLQTSSPVVLDRVVAVVNNQAILDSDIDDEIRLSVLDAGRVGLGVLTRTNALDQLIARALIEQQIRQEDLQSASPTQDEVDARLAEIRKELPSCVRQHCATEEGWKAFLALHSLTRERVESYLRHRVEILRFIEQRFRQGIDISAQEIETYYHDTLLPQYAAGEAVPPLDEVSKRIEEILLQRQVNMLFDGWLNNLRKQGDIEVLDPTIQPATEAPAQAPPATQSAKTAGSPGGSGKAKQ